jgi:transposase
MARPQKINQQLIDKLVAAIRQGAYIETASAYVGINKDTFYDWLKKAAREKDERNKALANGVKRLKQYELQVQLSDAIEKATAESELFDLSTITQAAKNGAWQAAAWRLERKFPKRYGPAALRLGIELQSHDTKTAVDSLIDKLKGKPND